MAEAKPSMGCGICCIVGGVFMLVFGIMGIVEQGRFTPFYTPIKCSNLYLNVPMQYALHVVPTVVNGTVTDATYTTTVMGATGAPMADGGNQVTSTAPVPTTAQYDAAPYVPVGTTCENKNEFAATLLGSSNGKVLIANPTTPNDYSTYFEVGHTTVIGDVSLPLQGSATGALGLKMQVPDALTKALFAGLGVAQPGVTGVCASNCVAPMFFDLRVLKTTLDVTLLGLGKQQLDVLPSKYCAQYIKATVDGNGHSFITTAGPTYCRNSAAEIIATMVSASVHAEAVAGTAAPTASGQGKIDNMDPTKEFLDKNEGEVGMMCLLAIIMGFLGFIGLTALGGYKIKLANEAPKPEQKEAMQESA